MPAGGVAKDLTHAQLKHASVTASDEQYAQIGNNCSAPYLLNIVAAALRVEQKGGPPHGRRIQTHGSPSPCERREAATGQSGGPRGDRYMDNPCVGIEVMLNVLGASRRMHGRRDGTKDGRTCVRRAGAPANFVGADAVQGIRPAPGRGAGGTGNTHTHILRVLPPSVRSCGLRWFWQDVWRRTCGRVGSTARVPGLEPCAPLRSPRSLSCLARSRSRRQPVSAQGFKEGGVAVARVAGREETASPFGGSFCPVWYC